VNQLSSDIIQVFQGESPNITALVATVGSLTTSLATKDKVIGQVIHNLNSVLKTITSRGNALGNLVTTLQQLVSGLAADRQPIGSAIAAISSLTSATAGLLQVGRAPLAADITQLGRLSQNLAANSGVVSTFLQDLPGKMALIARASSYGSWFNLYLCSATVTGVKNAFGGPAPGGVPITAARCRS
jgi:phospholipid/cholesterol/gamma-HCH transport system substrate-binding protein